MTEAQELDAFARDHPYPDKIGIKSLFKFSKFDGNHTEYQEDLFLRGKLYHSLPDNFNDPFECKPNFKWPNNLSQVRAIRKHLINKAIRDGYRRKDAESLISKNMRKPGFIQETIYNSIQNVFSKIRICSFTTKKENLLFWSHYADSHKGFCVEYDATVLPISYAFKVKYKDEYPEVKYPVSSNKLGFKPALIKSKEWEYEEEFRIIFVPDAKRQPKNDGVSLILNGGEMKNVYLGANMSGDNKQALIELIIGGPFSPRIWDVALSTSSFKLEFNERI